MRWDFDVFHYGDNQEKTWYPRAGTLGGCATHNAMITALPMAEEWDWLATMTGDSTWNR